MKIDTDRLMDNFLKFAENELDLDNILRYVVEPEEWEELVTKYFTQKLMDTESEDENELLEELYEQEEYIRKALKLDIGGD